MKEGISYTVTLNFVITFIIIFIAFLSATLIYYKSNKVSNIIINSIEKFEGYNDKAINEINNKITDLGYNKHPISCDATISNGKCYIVNDESKEIGYCVYECDEDNYYYYRIKTNMMLSIPVINDILNIPIFFNTNRLYDFELKFD